MLDSTHPVINPDDVFLKPRVAADWLGTSVVQLAKLRMRGDGPPFVKLGCSVRYRVGDVRQWAEAQSSRMAV